MADQPSKGLMRWVTTTNHKDIGTLYLVFSLTMFFVAGFLALMIRTELSSPYLMVMSPLVYNQMVTAHGLLMIFGAIMPALAGFANWMIPLMIGAADMAFPRLNNWSFWLLPFASLMLFSPFFVNGPAPDMGWTFYAPLSTTYGPPGTDAMIFSIHMLGISSILASINIIATIFNLRAPGMTLMNMPMFVWSWLVTAFLILAIMPILAGTVTMMLTDRHFGTSFFDAAGGGSPLLFEHLFWFFGHPEVYVLALPVFGIISEIIPTFSRKPLFGATSMIYAIACIGILSFVVWVHHMFTTGVYLGTQLFFMYTTMIVAVPTGVKVFNWMATMYKGAITLEPPMMFAVGFVFLFTIGGLTGVMLAIVPADYQYHATYFVVGHFHYVIVAGLYFGLVAGAYYWVPKWTGRMYNFTLAHWHFWLTLISSNITFFPMLLVGLAGMPRRIPDYNLQFTDFNQMATVGAFMFGISQILFVIAMFQAVKTGKKAGKRIWEGAKGLEWTLPTPLPYHTFDKPPHVEGKTYL